MSATRSSVTALVLGTVLAAALPVSGAQQPKAAPAKPEVDPLWPTKMAPHNWPTNPGTRYEMAELVRLVARKDIVIRAKIPGWRSGDMGTFRVGDQFHFEAILAHRASQKWGSVKEHRDGGTLTCTVHWMDGGGKVVKRDPDIIKGGCVCSGVYSLYLNIPSWAKTARHRLRMHYVNKRLKMDVRKDFFFRVVNDGSWRKSPLLKRLRSTFPMVVTLQNGVPCPGLKITAYKGAADTYMHATHRVPDRNSDFVNYGGLTMLMVGTYGQVKRTLVRFELGNMRPASPVKEAYLQLYYYASPGRHPKAPEMVAYDVLKDWGAGKAMGNRWRTDHVAAGDATWLCHQHPTRWSAPGCGAPGKDRSPKPVGTGLPFKAKKGWATLRLDPALVQRWIDKPKTNRGVLVQDPEEGRKGSRCGYYRSGEFEDPQMRPRLVVAFSSKVKPSPTCTPDGCPAP